MNIRKSVKMALAMNEQDNKWLSLNTGFSVGHLHNILNRDNVTVVTIQKLAKAFDMKVSTFIALGEE